MFIWILLRWTGDLSRIYPVSRLLTAENRHQPSRNLFRYRKWMDVRILVITDWGPSCTSKKILVFLLLIFFAILLYFQLIGQTSSSVLLCTIVFHSIAISISGDSYVRNGAHRAAKTIGGNLDLLPFFLISLQRRAAPDVRFISCDMGGWGTLWP